MLSKALGFWSPNQEWTACPLSCHRLSSLSAGSHGAYQYFIIIVTSVQNKFRIIKKSTQKNKPSKPNKINESTVTIATIRLRNRLNKAHDKGPNLQSLP